MKKNDEKMSLEQLLASVEHAGRDARRQRDLADMIENMASEEVSKKDATLRRTVRIAVAAAITLFISTSVWHWLLPQQSPRRQAAIAPVVRPLETPRTHLVMDMSDISTRRPQRHALSVPHQKPQPIQPYLCSDSMGTTETEALLQPVEETDQPPTELYAESVADSATAIPLDEVQLAADTTVPETMEQTPDKRNIRIRHNGIFSIFRRPEPDMMEGNVLAFQIL